MAHEALQVGIVGTGFIANYHAEAIARIPGANLAAVCDVRGACAKVFAKAHGVPRHYAAFDEMLSDQRLDVIHILTPPDVHFAAAEAALKAGASVLLEKPMCADVASCDALLEEARSRGLSVGVGQNTLFHWSYEQLRQDVREGKLGPLDHLRVTWHWELPFLKQGPFDLWMLREPGNIMLETGAHVLAHVLDLVGGLEDLSVRVSDGIRLPGRRRFYRRWRISGYCQRTAVDLGIAFVPGFAERSIHVRGTLANATVDLENNTYVLRRGSRYTEDFGRYHALVGEARSLRRQARRNLGAYVFSKLGLGDRGNAFRHSILQCVRAFYANLGQIPDGRNAGDFGRRVVDQCIRIARFVPVEEAVGAEAPQVYPGSSRKPDVLVTGGTGFIGRELVRQLVAGGRSVRLLTRNAGRVPFDRDVCGLEIREGSLQSDDEVARAIEGVPCVIHLARAVVKTWPDYYEQDVLATKRLADQCLRGGVKRLIYTGTIASYYAGAKAGVITEETPLDPRIDRRDNYSHAKTLSERILMEMFQERGLPVVIFRPGIVIGQGGAACHWGVGMWSGFGVCQLWGDGKNKLPFVLVEDVAKALIAGIDVPGIEGESFNLIGDPQLSGLEYLDELQRFGGVRLQVFPTPIWRYYVHDLFKWVVKVLVRHPGRRLPSYWEWETRTAKAVFDCTKAKTRLGWRPVADRRTLIVRGIHCPYLESLNGGCEPIDRSEPCGEVALS